MGAAQDDPFADDEIPLPPRCTQEGLQAMRDTLEVLRMVAHWRERAELAEMKAEKLERELFKLTNVRR